MNLERDPYAEGVTEHLKNIGVEAVLFDLDDTLIYTSEIFRMAMADYAIAVSNELGLDGYENVLDKLKVINDEAYREFGVRPDRWQEVAKRLAEVVGDDKEVCVQRVDVLMSIYTTTPRVRPSVRGVLQELAKGGIKVGLVTHAAEDWTKRKLQTTGLDRYFVETMIVPVEGSKTAEHWRLALVGMEVSPEHAVVVGDNLKGDVVAGTSLGMRGVWMPSPWSVYREGEVPEGVVQIENTDQLLEGLMALR